LLVVFGIDFALNKVIYQGDKMITFSKSHAIMEKALNYRSARQDLIAGNIANVDTPFYRPRDLSFQDSLRKEANKIFKEPEVAKLKLARTNGAHFETAVESNSDKAKLFYRDGHLARNDGNSVDLDVETSEMTKNSMMYQTIVASMKKNGAIFKAVIESSKATR